MKKRVFAMLLLIALIISSGLINATVQAEAYKNKNIKELAKSMGISKKNIDLATVYDTRQLSEKEIEYLVARGLSETEVRKMDRGAFFDFQKTLPLSNEDIKNLLIAYPELTEEDISSWTYGDYDDYSLLQVTKSAKLDEKSLKAISKLGITEADFWYLLKEYKSVEDIITEDADTIRQKISDYYQTKIDFVELMNFYETDSKNNVLSFFNINAYAAQPPSPYLNNYVIIQSFAGYNVYGDYFHKDAGTQYSWNKIQQEASARTLYQRTYNTTTSLLFTNMWGTYSQSSNGTHEGIDLAKGQYSNIYNPVNTSLSVAKEYHDPVLSSDYIVVLQGGNKSYFFIHMHDESVNSSTSVGYLDLVGREGKRHPTKTLASHLHFAVESGYTTTTHDATDDHELDSANPYIF